MPPLWTIIVAWLALINLIAFVAVWRDKRKAEQGAWRIQERTLWTMGALGGVWGMIVGMRRFRHKTRKLSFLIVTTLLVLLNLGYYGLAIHLWLGWRAGA